MKSACVNLTFIAIAIAKMGATLGETAAHVDNARTAIGCRTDKIAVMETLLERLEAAALEIAKIAKTFACIASENKLSSIEAATEAAIAGVAGSHFTLVPDEIQKASGALDAFGALIGTVASAVVVQSEAINVLVENIVRTSRTSEQSE